MRFEGTLTTWNDERGFGRIEPTQGGEPIFVHVSAWPQGAGRPALNQAVSFEVELGPKGKRARRVQLMASPRTSAHGSAHRTPHRSQNQAAQWGTASLFALPAYALIYAILMIVWAAPLWGAGVYAAASAATFFVYSADKSAAARGHRRTPESTLHTLALIGGWPGALLAQQLLRHKSVKQPFRQIFWLTVLLNIIGLIALASPAGRLLIAVL